MSATNTRFWYHFLRHPIKEIKFQRRWWHWFLHEDPIIMGHKMYGDGEQRSKNIKLLHDRWFERQPKRDEQKRP